MICLAIGFCFRNIELVFLNDCPAGLGKYPERGNAVVVRKVIPVGHIRVTEIDVEIGVFGSFCRKAIIETTDVNGIFGS